MKFNWTSDTDKEMLALWDSGMSASKIGAKLGTTKGSVIGRHRRLTLGLIKGKAAVLNGKSTKASPKAKIKVKAEVKSKIEVKPKKPAIPPILDAHPSFDPTDGTWFLDDGTEAKNIRELLSKLPEGSTIKDYTQRC